MTNQPRAVSVFSGVGGLDLGARAAGLRVRLAIDADIAAAISHHAAFGTPAVVAKIEHIELSRLTNVIATDDDILIGGPPCTAFSHAGFWLERKRNGDDAQVGRISDYVGFITALRPRAFVMENVPGLLFKTHQHVFRKLVRSAETAGYTVSYALLNAADFGVPQQRRRLIVIGVRNRPAFDFGTLLTSPLRRTTSWAFAGLNDHNNPPERDERLTGKYAHLLKRVPPGGNYLHFTAERGCKQPLFEWRKKYWSFLLKLHPDAVSPTIPATRISNNGPFHWQNRRLRVLELSRLQTFPDSFPFGSLADARRHIGNAVPPLLAAAVIWQLRVHLRDTRAGRMPDVLRACFDPRSSFQEVSDALETCTSQRPR